MDWGILSMRADVVGLEVGEELEFGDTWLCAGRMLGKLET